MVQYATRIPTTTTFSDYSGLGPFNDSPISQAEFNDFLSPVEFTDFLGPAEFTDFLGPAEF